MMNTGINIGQDFTIEETIDAFKENGIDRTFVCTERSDFHKVMESLYRADITVDNFHGPFVKQNDIWLDNDLGKKMLERYKTGVDCCVEYGIKLMIVHASTGLPMPPISEIGTERYDRFMEYADDKGIKIAFENHRFVENMEHLLNRYPHTGFCLDTCHEASFTPGVRYMSQWGKRLVATHISDSELSCKLDAHMIPFDGDSKLDITAREIAESGYNGTVMLEIKQGNHKRYKGLSAKEYYARAAARLRKFASLVESYK